MSGAIGCDGGICPQLGVVLQGQGGPASQEPVLGEAEAVVAADDDVIEQ